MINILGIIFGYLIVGCGVTAKNLYTRLFYCLLGSTLIALNAVSKMAELFTTV